MKLPPENVRTAQIVIEPDTAAILNRMSGPAGWSVSQVLNDMVRIAYYLIEGGRVRDVYARLAAFAAGSKRAPLTFPFDMLEYPTMAAPAPVAPGLPDEEILMAGDKLRTILRDVIQTHPDDSRAPCQITDESLADALAAVAVWEKAIQKVAEAAAAAPETVAPETAEQDNPEETGFDRLMKLREQAGFVPGGVKAAVEPPEGQGEARGCGCHVRALQGLGAAATDTDIPVGHDELCEAAAGSPAT